MHPKAELYEYLTSLSSERNKKVSNFHVYFCREKCCFLWCVYLWFCWQYRRKMKPRRNITKRPQVSFQSLFFIIIFDAWNDRNWSPTRNRSSFVPSEFPDGSRFARRRAGWSRHWGKVVCIKISNFISKILIDSEFSSLTRKAKIWVSILWPQLTVPSQGMTSTTKSRRKISV